MMTCQDDLVQMYVDGDLQPAEGDIVEAHLATCESCRRRAVFYKGLFWDLAHTERFAPASDLEPEALAEALRAEWVKGQEPKPVGAVALATLWFTANPVFTGTAHAAGRALASPAQAAGRALTGLGWRLIGRKGGGSR
ncbi:MAG: hypothetical protein JWN15_950 [Firmicutes bacterium]|nr:hypothetical protein [Bacillota bacterium]